MQLHILLKKTVLVLIFFISMSNIYAESPLSTIKDILKEEINRSKEQIKEELRRALDSANSNTSNTNNDEYKSVVPDLIGKTPQEAEYLLPQYHLVLGKVLDKESNKPSGTIISQSHAPNLEVKQQTAISVEVAVPRHHPAHILVPNVQGMPLNKAKALIKQADLTVGKIKKRESDLATGLIIGQQPKAGITLNVKGKLDLIVATPKLTPNAAQVLLSLNKKQAKVTESIVMTATAVSASKEPLEYSFTIDGKVYPSSSNQLSHRFNKAGKVIITANVRKKRGKWLHSKSQWLKVEDQPEKITTAHQISVPNVIGLSLSEAKALLTDKNLTVSQVLQEKSTGSPRILKQSPVAGTSLPEGGEVILTQSVEYTIKLMLSANKTEINEHESVDFHVAIQGDSPDRTINYRLFVDEETLNSQTPDWTYTFNKAGSYPVVAEAEIEGLGSYRSTALTIQVSGVWDEPRAIIEPSSLVVTKGDTATFISQSSHDKKTKLTLYWMDEKGGSGQKNTYAINTKDWDEGEYWLSLRVKDEQGFEHTSKAELIISSELDNSTNDRNTIEKDSPKLAAKDIQLSLSASAYHVISEKPVQFTISQYPTTQSTYRVIFDDKNKEVLTKPWLQHSFTRMGRHTIYVETDFQNQLIQSKKITIWVWPSWLLIAVAVAGLFFLFKLFKLLKSTPKAPSSRHNKKNNTMRYMPTLDEGEQSMEVEQNTQNKNTHFSFEAEIDEGKQWIAYTEKTKD